MIYLHESQGKVTHLPFRTPHWSDLQPKIGTMGKGCPYKDDILALTFITCGALCHEHRADTIKRPLQVRPRYQIEDCLPLHLVLGGVCKT